MVENKTQCHQWKTTKITENSTKRLRLFIKCLIFSTYHHWSSKVKSLYIKMLFNKSHRILTLNMAFTIFQQIRALLSSGERFSVSSSWIKQNKLNININYFLYVPSHEKTCINDIKCDFLFLHTSCISNCAEQMLKNSCSYLV